MKHLRVAALTLTLAAGLAGCGAASPPAQRHHQSPAARSTARTATVVPAGATSLTVTAAPPAVAPVTATMTVPAGYHALPESSQSLITGPALVGCPAVSVTATLAVPTLLPAGVKMTAQFMPGSESNHNQKLTTIATTSGTVRANAFTQISGQATAAVREAFVPYHGKSALVMLSLTDAPVPTSCLAKTDAAAAGLAAGMLAAAKLNVS